MWPWPEVDAPIPGNAKTFFVAEWICAKCGSRNTARRTVKHHPDTVVSMNNASSDCRCEHVQVLHNWEKDS